MRTLLLLVFCLATPPLCAQDDVLAVERAQDVRERDAARAAKDFASQLTKKLISPPGATLSLSAYPTTPNSVPKVFRSSA